MDLCLNCIVPVQFFRALLVLLRSYLHFIPCRRYPLIMQVSHLIIFAIILFLLEIKIVSHGLLAIGGIISLLLGSMMLIPTRFIAGICKNFMSVIISSVAVTLFFSCLLSVWVKSTTAETCYRHKA